MVLLKLKRKVSYRGHYIYGHVGPQKLRDALTWMKDNNPLYKNVLIMNGWKSALVDKGKTSDNQDKPIQSEPPSIDSQTNLTLPLQYLILIVMKTLVPLMHSLILNYLKTCHALKTLLKGN